MNPTIHYTGNRLCFQGKSPTPADEIRLCICCETVKNAKEVFHGRLTKAKPSSGVKRAFVVQLEFKLFAFGKADNAEDDGSDAGSCANNAKDKAGDGKAFHKAVPPVRIASIQYLYYKE